MPGKEAGLGDAEQDARGVEAPRPVTNIIAMETRPQPIMMRAIQQARADALEDQVAGDLEQAVAEEEQAGAEAVLRVGSARGRAAARRRRSRC